MREKVKAPKPSLCLPMVVLIPYYRREAVMQLYDNFIHTLIAFGN
jgi:hypothetical protein